MPIQQLMLGVGAKKKTYMDDVFSTYLYEGDSSNSQNINNGLNLSGEGGMVWIKNRGSTYGHQLFDTVRGVNKRLRVDLDSEEDTVSNSVTAFNSNGLTVGTSGEVSDNNTDHASWSFRKSKGWFDVVEWTGGGETYKNISHNLGSVPGCIIVKKYDGGSGDWFVSHRELNNGTDSWQYRVALNKDWTAASAGQSFLYSAPTATQFQIGDWFTNSGTDYIAYVFAGGESGAATANSVDFGGDNSTTQSYLRLAPNSTADFNFGTGDFTFECWVKPDGLAVSGDHWKRAWSIGTSSGTRISLVIESSGSGYFTSDGSTSWGLDFPSKTFFVGQWTHVAFVRESNVIKIYANGVFYASTSFTSSLDFSALGNILYIGMDVEHGQNTSWNGRISNFRIVKGTAVYTSSFRPPTEPLTNITNTTLLCCNHPTNKNASTVTPVTISAYGNETAGTNSPFDDPAAFTFGENGDQAIIKCGSYVGNGSSTGPTINLGWEPQWWLVKRTDSSANWQLLDSMRGWGNGSNDQYFATNNNTAEGTYAFGHPSSTGFVLDDSHAAQNADGGNYIYIAIRRPDGYVGKPADAGTDVFTMAYGNSAGTNPSYVSNFPVDFALTRQPTTSESWYVGARLMQGKHLYTNTTNSDLDASSNFLFDHNNGWRDGSAVTAYLSWMWKRHAGFDVVTYKGNQVNGRHIKHNLGKAPEMIWIKNRDSAQDWVVGHKGVNGGTNPWDYFLKLNLTDAQQDYPLFNDFTPTSTVFSVHNNSKVNWTDNYIALLFSSVDGISKVGSYTGTSGQLQLRNLGFTPRFLLVKRTDGTGNWVVIDTTQGWGSGDDKKLFFNTDASQATQDVGDPVSSGGGGFDLYTGNDDFNNTDNKYIYYAHA